jgi:hypothetical protein
VARRHGTVRASTVACCLRSDDTALLAEIAADRRLRALGLRQLAPTVLAADTDLSDTHAALRKAGYAPVAEAADGTPVIQRVAAHRTSIPSGTGVKAPRRKPAPASARRTTPPEPDPAAVARALLSAPDAQPAASSPSLPSLRTPAAHLRDSDVRVLAHAIDHHRPVGIDYIDREGNPTSRVIENIELSGPFLSARCRLRDADRMFKLNRISGVRPATE